MTINYFTDDHRLSREILEEIIINAPLPLQVWKKVEEKYLNIAYNKAYDEFASMNGKKFLGKDIKQLDLDFNFFPYFEKCFKSKSSLQEVIKYRGRNGEMFLALNFIYLPPNFILVHIEDITEKRKANEKLRDSERKYRTLFEEALNPIFIVDENGSYVDLNEAAREFLEDKREDIIGKNTFDYSPPGFFKEQKKKHSPFYSRRTLETHYFVNGRIKILILNVVPFEYMGEKRLFGIGQDITDLKRIESELKKSHDKYKQAFNQTKFYRDIVVHDIRNILQNIKSSIHMTKYYLQDAFNIDEVLNFNSIIHQQLIRGEKLISNINKLSKIEEEKPNLSRENVIRYLQDAIDYINKTFPNESIEIQLNSKKNEYYICANNLLQDVFENILLNAIKYNEHELIEISIDLSLKTENDQEYVVIEVKDNGIGIPDSLKKAIFKKTEAGKGGKGMGVGLSLVRTAMSLYDGNITVKNRVEDDYTKGSNFILSIPTIK
jgi:PAS domain S-box-containing protein